MKEFRTIDLPNEEVRELKKLLPNISNDEWRERTVIQRIQLTLEEIDSIVEKSIGEEPDPYFDYTTNAGDDFFNSDEYEEYIENIVTPGDLRALHKHNLMTKIFDIDRYGIEK